MVRVDTVPIYLDKKLKYPRRTENPALITLNISSHALRTSHNGRNKYERLLETAKYSTALLEGKHV